MERDWRDNAREFGALNKQGYDVRLGVLVACSVESANNRSREPSKVGIGEFARTAGCSKDTVARYLTAWDKMVAAGWQNMSRDLLTPDKVETLDMPAQFRREYEAMPKGGHVAKARELDITPGAAAVVNTSRANLRQAILADPETAKVAGEAVRAAKQKAEREADKRLRERMADRGLDVDRPPIPFPMELIAEANRISALLEHYTGDLRRLMKRAEADQQPRLLDHLRPAVHGLIETFASYESIPDDLSSLDR